MNEIRSCFRRRQLLATLSLLIILPYTLVLFKIAAYLIALHPWSNLTIGLMAALLIFRTIHPFVKMFRGDYLKGYRRLTSDNDPAYSKLNEVFTKIFAMTGTSFRVAYYLYPLHGSDAGKTHTIAVIQGKGEFLLKISEKNLNEFSPEVLTAVMLHETGHVLVSRWSGILRWIRAVIGTPVDALTLIIPVAVGFISWWYFIPALFATALIYINVVNIPFRIGEYMADYFVARMGLGYYLIRYLESLKGKNFAFDGVHPSIPSRIAHIKRHMH